MHTISYGVRLELLCEKFENYDKYRQYLYAKTISVKINTAIPKIELSFLKIILPLLIIFAHSTKFKTNVVIHNAIINEPINAKKLGGLLQNLPPAQYPSKSQIKYPAGSKSLDPKWIKPQAVLLAIKFCKPTGINIPSMPVTNADVWLICFAGLLLLMLRL